MFLLKMVKPTAIWLAFYANSAVKTAIVLTEALFLEIYQQIWEKVCYFSQLGDIFSVILSLYCLEKISLQIR